MSRREVRRSRVNRSSARSSFFEPLEERRMMAVFSGTPGNDTITAYVSGGIAHVVVNGVDQLTFDAQLDILGNGGNDTININGVPALTLASVQLGDGFNVVHVGNGDFDTNIQGNVDISGTFGNDTVIVQDGSDGTNDFDYYEFTNFTFRKPTSSSATLSYFNIENVTVNASAHNDPVKIISTNAATHLVWNAGLGDDTLYVGDGDLSLIKGTITLNGGSGADDVIFYDYNVDTGMTYDVYNSTLVREGLADVNFSGAERFGLNSAKGSDVINIRTGTGSLMSTFSANTGDDTFNIFTTSYNVAAVQEQFSFFGDGGSDSINLFARSGNFFYSVYPTSLEGSFLPTFHHLSVEDVHVTGGRGNETYLVFGTKTGVDTSIDAGDGSDTIAVGGAFGAIYTLDDIKGPLSIDAGAGTDILAMVDRQQTASRTFTINDTTIARNNMAAFDYANSERLELYGGATIDTFSVLSNLPTTSVIVDGGGGLDQVIVNSDQVGSAEVHFNSTQDLLVLQVWQGGSVVVDANGSTTIDTKNISLHPSGRIDLNDNAMILDYTPTGGTIATSVRTWLQSGRNGGTWNGANGIKSSFAAAHPGRGVGYAESSALFSNFPVSFAGRDVDSTAILVRCTLNGDANLDRAVNAADFTRLATNFGKTQRVWSDGDFTFDGTVNAGDFTMMATNFGATFSDEAITMSRVRAISELDMILR